MAVSDAERATLTWTRASASVNTGACVELAAASSGVAMRDSKNPGGPVLLCVRDEFRLLLDRARSGELDAPERSPH